MARAAFANPQSPALPFLDRRPARRAFRSLHPARRVARLRRAGAHRPPANRPAQPAPLRLPLPSSPPSACASLAGCSIATSRKSSFSASRISPCSSGSSSGSSASAPSPCSAGDALNPRLQLQGIPRAVELRERLRHEVIVLRQRYNRPRVRPYVGWALSDSSSPRSQTPFGNTLAPRKSVSLPPPSSRAGQGMVRPGAKAPFKESVVPSLSRISSAWRESAFKNSVILSLSKDP